VVIVSVVLCATSHAGLSNITTATAAAWRTIRLPPAVRPSTGRLARL